MEKICYHGRQGKEWKELRGLFPRSSFFQDRFDILEQRETAMNRKRLTKRILALSLTSLTAAEASVTSAAGVGAGQLSGYRRALGGDGH